jgi:hypothetical protein
MLLRDLIALWDTVYDCVFISLDCTVILGK